MKHTIKNTVSVMLALSMMITAFAGCKSSKNGTTSDSSDEWEIVEEVVSGSDTNSDAGDSKTSSKPDNRTDSKGNASGNSSKAGSDNGKETNLSWKEIKAMIPESAKGKTIEVYTWNAKETQASTVIDRFTKETGIKIKWTVGTDYSQIAVAARVAAGDSPDVTRVRSSLYPTNLKVLQPLSDINFNFNDKHWDKNIMKAYTVNGKTYAAMLKDSPYTQYPVVCYNSNLIENYGLEDPYALWKKGNWTWNKMHSIAGEFLEAAGEGYNGISQSSIQYADCLGVPMVTVENEKIVSNISNPKFLTACKYMAQAYSEGLYDTTPRDLDAFNSEKLLFLITSTISMRNGHYTFRELKEKGNAKCVPLPKVDGQSDYYASIDEWEAYGICKGAKNADLVPYFLRYYLDKDNYDMSSFYSDQGVQEIVKWYTTQTKWNTPNIISEFATDDSVGITMGPLSQQILATSPSQMQSRLDSYAPKFEAAAAEYNNQIKEITK